MNSLKLPPKPSGVKKSTDDSICIFHALVYSLLFLMFFLISVSLLIRQQ